MNSPVVYVPDGSDPQTALNRSTHFAIGAHQDDLEILGFHGIIQGLGQVPQSGAKQSQPKFSGIVLSDGRGSPRDGRFANITDQEMVAIRHKEQMRAAHLGRYSSVTQLGLTSDQIKGIEKKSASQTIQDLLQKSNCTTVYTHSPADRHDTHVATLAIVLDAISNMPRERRPKSILGCEVWRDLDWVPEHHLIKLDVSGHEALATNLLGCFESQLAGGKRYDLAVVGRRRAHATFRDSYTIDQSQSVILALELAPFIDDPLGMLKWIEDLQEEFKNDVQSRCLRFFKKQ